ncbi:uncharacterized protein LOC126811114 [Patella vulgata]|uniref:uncharacterized protein LOC126811114 n=1 Tax=Patella vulgata TaxID=6465 RepID=UPI0021805EEF|nr:uncharacterized protein LOC126811114 [Patella vulgata]XP_050392540.1 uncharacterized protein LOC126811114 [Patella vulgata]XP_050392542.1 uncharacterized protein LOC126811114 [Patella vulgata]
MQKNDDIKGGKKMKDKIDFVIKLRDRQPRLVTEWNKVFSDDIKDGIIEVSQGDIFRDAPSADAIVSPANSFGFMDGGIDMAYSMHFGWQMQHRLQKNIREKYGGELLVGQAEIIPTFDGGAKEDSMNWSAWNGGKPIKYLISAPTMRVPLFVDDSVNSYLAFRAVILAVKKFNTGNPTNPIKSVLCPGLGTAVGRMPADRCAYQMKNAFDTFLLDKCPRRINPTRLEQMSFDTEVMQRYHVKCEDDDDDDDEEEEDDCGDCEEIIDGDSEDNSDTSSSKLPV